MFFIKNMKKILYNYIPGLVLCILGMYRISGSTGYPARIWVSGSTGYLVHNYIRYYPVSGRISIPVLSGTIIIGIIYLILDHLKCVRSLKKSSSDVNFIKKSFLVESQTHPQSMTNIEYT